MTRPQPRYKPGDKIGGRYQVHKALMGGMGEVYLCLDLKENYPYALKTFQQRYQSAALRKAFEQEVATWVALEKHSNIVRCFYLETLDNQPFMLLEWITSYEGRGNDLRSWIRRGPLDLQLALDFTIDICRGLIHAQEKQAGIVHRDLKPENILIGQGRLAKITDFGLAQVVHVAGLEITDEDNKKGERQSLLDQASIVGTPPYMAPEQWHGETSDARTDIYAVGCVLYEMLSGSWLFQASTREGLRRQHLEASIPKLATSGLLPNALDTLLAHCLAKQREERFGSVGDLLKHLSFMYERQFAEPPKSIPLSDEFTAEDYTNRGSTYNDLKLYDKALADQNQSVQLSPNLPPAYNNRGITYHELKQYNEALTDYNYAIQLDPAFAQVYHNRGLTYHELQQYDEALTDYNQAILLDPDYVIAYVNRGKNFHELKQYDRALSDYYQAIQLDPNYAKVYIYRGITYHKLQQYDEALADYSLAIHLNPSDAIVYNNRGITYRELKKYNEALADYDQALQLAPNYATACCNRGLCYHDLQQYDEALIDYDRAIQLDANYAGAYNNRGNTHHDLQQYNEALVDRSRAIELSPSLAQAYYNRGNTYAGLEQYKEALADFNQAIQLDPSYSEAYFNVGSVYGKLGKLREALRYFEKAAECGLLIGVRYAAQTSQNLAFEAFQHVSSLNEMQCAVVEFPLMIESDFFTTIEHAEVPLEDQPIFEQHLTWLRQIAQEQNQ